jgi:Ser-tRNA(Ala) deacylase AlaX
MEERNKNLLTCQTDSYVREGFSKVLKCEKVADSTNYKIILDNSVLYPEGGGQPFDLGFVNGISVLKVLKPEESCIKEFADRADLNPRTLVEVELQSPLEVNETVKCEVDWARRYDFMQQHSAQHLFSAIADKLFSAETVGWALGSEIVTVDLKSTPMISIEQVLEVEKETNRMIRENKSIQFKVYSKDELQANLQAKVNAENDAGDHEFKNFRGEVKGAALQLDELRLVFIEDLDINPCGGTHISSLSEINIFKVIGFEKDMANNVMRVKFLAGDRAINYFHQAVTRETQISQLLSSKPVDFVNTIDKLLKDKKDLNKKYDIYNDELAYYYGKALLNRAITEYQLKDKSDSSPLILIEHRYGADLKFLLRAANTFFDEKKDADLKIILFISGDENAPVPFVSPAASAGKPSKKEGKGKENSKESSIANQGKPITDGPFVLFGEPEDINKVKDKALSLLVARGGGKPGRLQGFAQSLSNLPQLAPELAGAFK